LGPGPAPVAPGQRALHGFRGEGAIRYQPRCSALSALRRVHAETLRQLRSVLGLWPVSTLPGDAEKSRIGLRRKIGATAPASLTQRGFPCLTPPGAPIYFRLRTLSHSTDTVHLANQIIVGCCWLPGSAAPAHGRQQKQRVSPDLSKREFSLESLQQSVAFVAVGLRRRSPGRCVSLRETAVA